MSRGNTEKNAGKAVTIKTIGAYLEDREDLPTGVGFLESPLFHLPDRPWTYLVHVMRYYHLAHQLMQAMFHEFPAEPVNGQPLSVLDIGCGYGEMKRFLSGYMRPKGYRLQYQGIDADPTTVSLAQQLTPSANITVGVLPQALEGLGPFQGFVCSEVLEHLTVEEGKELFRLMNSIAVPGAIAAFSVPTPELSKVKQYDFHQHEYTVNEMLGLVRASGWELIIWYWLRVRVTDIPNQSSMIPNPVLVSANSPLAPLDPELSGAKDALYLMRKL